jgi:hypothetical protein
MPPKSKKPVDNNTLEIRSCSCSCENNPKESQTDIIKENVIMDPNPAIDSPIVHSPVLKLKARGTRADVYNGVAKRTGGGLKKDDLMVNARNQIVSKKVSEIRKNIPKDKMFKKNAK